MTSPWADCLSLMLETLPLSTEASLQEVLNKGVVRGRIKGGEGGFFM